jgi:hypothetical protein
MINNDRDTTNVSPAAISFASDCMPALPDTSLPNPCDPAWQLGLYPGDYATFDAELDAGEQDAVTKFEALLQGDTQAPIGSRWVGNSTVPRHDQRAVVQVDVYAHGHGPGSMIAACGQNPALIEHGLWYLAAVPMTATGVLTAIASGAYAASPIGAKVLGYCYPDHTFRATQNECGSKPDYAVVKYDPKCVCNGIGTDVMVDATN